MAKESGGELIAKMLQKEGVEQAFGIVDGSYLALCAGLVKQGIKLTTPRHESTAAHMAGAYSRLSGKLPLVIASNGPGVANALPGVAVEEVEGNRVLLITSCRRTGIHYPNRGATFQAFDQVGVIGKMAKWSEAVPSIERLPELLRRALAACYRGRPGVVHLDVPENLINGKFEAQALWEPASYRSTYPLPPPDEAVKKAAQMLVAARLPILHAGGGVIHAGAFEELAVIAEILQAPVSSSWSGRSAMPEQESLCWPMVHVKANNELRNAADLVLCLGSRLGETDWWGKAPNWATPDQQQLIQVDLDPDVLGRIRPATLAIQADLKLFLRALAKELEARKGTIPIEARKKEVARLAQSKQKDRQKLDEKLADLSCPMNSAHPGHLARQVLDDDAVVVFDGGNTSVWGQFYCEARTPNSVLATHHMGHLGAGVGQALGAAVARPGKQVCCIIGDGAFGMHPQEIETAIRNELPVLFLVLCDRQWGMVKMTQSIAFKPVKMMVKKRLDPEETINSNLGEIDYAKLAESMGGYGARVADPTKLEAAIEVALASNRCAVIHVDVDADKHLWAPALMHFKTMHQEPKGK